uniref:NADH dehydrogenase subunit 6 n=1 Tax=Hippopus hippopus TaxID=80818 RepID=A0A3S7WCP8_9BIVA|nr:NADH dehydrogenase subunit 6 [Hippopus hippopus]QNK04086.1 NADH dehydrogenase subunit 6 [Hippopus hippopus]
MLSMMVMVVVSSVLFLSCVASVAALHPISLGCYMFVLTSFCSLLVSIEFSVFLGFCLYMVVVGGLLVVFAYAAALSPAASFKLSFKKVCPIMLLWCSLWSIMKWVLSLGPEVHKAVKDYQHGLGIGFDWGWGFVVIFLAAVLFVIMVSAVNVCMVSGSGALVAKSPFSKKVAFSRKERFRIRN